MKIKLNIEYDTKTKELKINGKNKGKCSDGRAADIILRSFAVKNRRAELDTIINNSFRSSF